MLLDELARTSAAVAETRARLQKTRLLAACLERLRADEVPVAVAYLSGELPHAPIGVGWAALRELPPPAVEPTLELSEVDTTLRAIGAVAGPGSQARRRGLLDGLLSRATEPEQRFLVRLLCGELRQGALEGVMIDAVAVAAQVPAPTVRRALMLAGSLRDVAAIAVAEGAAGLARFRLDLFRPLQPMLAQTADDVADALGRIVPAAVEWKLDGARIQVHRLGGEVRVFTRNLADVTARVPEVVEAVLALPAGAIVLDGETIALAEDGRPRPFQVTMSRFGSKLSIEELRARVPLSAVFFDCLHLEGEDLLDRPLRERNAALADAVPAALRVVTSMTLPLRTMFVVP